MRQPQMKKSNLLFPSILATTVLMLLGCATAPENIPPAYVSELSYLDLTCEQLADEQLRLVSALSTACDAQRKARSNDTAGVILLGLPVSSLSGSNQASNIGRLKGELEALQKAMIRKGCEAELIHVEDAIKKKEAPEQPKEHLYHGRPG